MANNGNLVREILREATIAASRPIDHARRIGTALFLGVLGGVILGIATVRSVPSFSQIGFSILAFIIIAALCLSPWAVKPKNTTVIPVVARVLGTRESSAVRRAKGGGTLVPVVCRPCVSADDNAPATGGKKHSEYHDFLAVVAVHGADPAHPIDPAPGTLLPLIQVEEGMGELTDMADGDVTSAQRELMARLEEHPKILRNKAPVLPLRRGALERVPAWAALEFWLSALIGATATVWALSVLFA